MLDGPISRSPLRRDRATRLLNYVGHVIVNGRPEVGDTNGVEHIPVTAKAPS